MNLLTRRAAQFDLNHFSRDAGNGKQRVGLDKNVA
jgi:hypothetical protein